MFILPTCFTILQSDTEMLTYLGLPFNSGNFNYSKFNSNQFVLGTWQGGESYSSLKRSHSEEARGCETAMKKLNNIVLPYSVDEERLSGSS